MKTREERKKEKAKYQEQRRETILRSRFPLVMVRAKPQKCGDCQACCEVIAVHLNNGQREPEDKPNYARCPHQCDSGCGIYEEQKKYLSANPFDPNAST